MKLFEFIRPVKSSLNDFISELESLNSDTTAVAALVHLFNNTPVDQTGSLLNRVNELLRMYSIPLIAADIDLFSRKIWYKHK